MLGIYVADLNADYIDMPFGRGGPATPGIPGSNSRTKRMRTSFKHHQLRTMKSYFAINHNPDAKDRSQAAFAENWIAEEGAAGELTCYFPSIFRLCSLGRSLWASR